eukprot:3469093-Lingulodinium_polyedra.AAC.1
MLDDWRQGLKTSNLGLEDPAVAAWAAVVGQRQQRPGQGKSRGNNGKNKDGVVGNDGGGQNRTQDRSAIQKEKAG